MVTAAAAAASKLLQSCLTLCDPRRQPTKLPRPWDSPGKNTELAFHFLLQCTKVKSESEVALEPQKIKSLTVSIVSPSSCHEVIGLDAMILVFEC